MSSISRCSPGGQPGGGGSRNSCSIAFSTWGLVEEHGDEKLLLAERRILFVRSSGGLGSGAACSWSGEGTEKYGSQDNLKPQWIREWKLRMYEPVRLVGWKDGAGESAMPRSRAHLLVTHVPVGPLSITHHFPHHYPEAPDITGGGMFSVGNDFWGCPAKHTTWALRGGVRSNSSSNYSRGHIYWATPTGHHVCPGCAPGGSTGGFHSSIQTPQRAPCGTHPGARLTGQHPLEKAEPPRLLSPEDCGQDEPLCTPGGCSPARCGRRARGAQRRSWTGTAWRRPLPAAWPPVAGC